MIASGFLGYKQQRPWSFFKNLIVYNEHTYIYFEKSNIWISNENIPFGSKLKKNECR